MYQPVSACYVPDIRRLYREVASVLRPGGCYCVEHWSPYQMQVGDGAAWDGRAYRLIHPQRPGKPVPSTWTVWNKMGRKHTARLSHFIHPLDDLIGGLCTEGFEILHFAEHWKGNPRAKPGSYAHRASYIPPFLSLFARYGTGSGRSPVRSRNHA